MKALSASWVGGWARVPFWPALALWFLGWVVVVSVVQPSLPVDNAEQLAWVRSLEWGYYKHPPLPTWVLWPLVQVAGLHAWTTTAMGMAIKALAVVVCFDLMRRMVGGRAAALATVAVCCVAYYSSRLHYYNHNVLLILTNAGAAWCLWRAWHEPQARWFIALGCCLGAGMLTKYQAITTFGSLWLFVWWNRADVDARHLKGLAWSHGVAILCFLPHAVWLLSHPSNPLTYLGQSTLAEAPGALQRLSLWWHWWAELVVVRSLGAWLCLGVWWWWSRSATVPAHGAPVALRAERLLLAWWLVPSLVITGMVLIGGATIRNHWGTPIAMWLVAYAVVRIRSLLGAEWPWQRGLWVAAVAQLALTTQLVWSEHSPRARLEPARWGKPHVERWAGPLGQQARQLLDGDIRVVVGPETVVASLAVALEERPYTLLNGRWEDSPWIAPDLIDRCGALFVVYESEAEGGQTVPLGPEGMRWRVVPPLQGPGCAGDLKRGAEGPTGQSR